MKQDVLARLSASGPRRIFACGVLGLLSMMLIFLAVITQPGLISRIVLLAAGVGVMALAVHQWRVTEEVIELTETELRLSSGLRLVAVSDVASVERGPMAFKPSQGFLLRTDCRQPRGWAPGLWWRFGRSVGVGGVTSAGEGKFMAETLQQLIAHRTE